MILNVAQRQLKPAALPIWSIQTLMKTTDPSTVTVPTPPPGIPPVMSTQPPPYVSPTTARTLNSLPTAPWFWPVDGSSSASTYHR
ncbi:MAG: hypothetical protein IPH09_15185 [bacterium]|nr:hypothetical protein [bacterium]